jgi:Domain of unknown function (DUF6285)
MRDLPPGPVLLSLARDVLLNDLLPLLPPEALLDARLIANGMAIAEREASVGESVAQAVLCELKSFYADTTAGRAANEDEGECDLSARFAHDLRIGAFEGSERKALDMLWRLTIGKLRQANPRFLAANGFT